MIRVVYVKISVEPTNERKGRLTNQSPSTPLRMKSAIVLNKNIPAFLKYRESFAQALFPGMIQFVSVGRCVTQGEKM